MKICSLITLIILQTTITNAQTLENYLASRLGLEEYTGDIKCATKYELELQLQDDNLAINLQNMYKKIRTEPVRAESLTTTHFTLHWNEEGTHAVPTEDVLGNGIPDYIDSAAVIFEYVWDVEINQMGYSPPPQQNGQPVTNYHIYFSNIPYYGLTTGSGIDIPSLPGENWTSYIEVDNDYQESYFASNGLDGLRVTAAHEFHHAIEFGYNIRQEDFFFYEMTATWLEDVLFTNVNDYYNYLSTLFSEIGIRSFDYYTSSTLYPYGNCLYLHMTSKQFGNEFVKDVWDEIINRPVIDALETTLSGSKYNSSWLLSLSKYGSWLYYTGNRAIPNEYFQEGEFYPQINSHNTYQFIDSLSFENNVRSNSFKYFKIEGAKGKILQSIAQSNIAIYAGQNLLDIKMVSDFSIVGDTLNGFISNEDSMIVLITNAEDFSDNFIIKTRLIENFVQIDSLVVVAKEGRNILSWTSKYEILNKEWKINRKKPGENFQTIHTIPGKEYSIQDQYYTYIDTDIEDGQNYQYQLMVAFFNDSIKTIDTIAINNLSPLNLDLLQNYPNPFNNETTIIVEILNNTEFSLEVYNILGQNVRTLQKKEIKPTGFYLYKWNGKNNRGQDVSSGIYFVKLLSKNSTNNIKLVYIR